MAIVHGKNAVILFSTNDLSSYANNVTFNRTADSHDVTTFGADSHVFKGGLGNGTAEVTGFYDDGAAGPRAIIEPLVGTNVSFVYRPEGTSSGLPQDTVSALVTAYEETVPVADIITWSCKLQLSGDVTTIDQSTA